MPQTQLIQQHSNHSFSDPTATKLRVSSVDSAQGFAQVLQAFDRPVELGSLDSDSQPNELTEQSDAVDDDRQANSSEKTTENQDSEDGENTDQSSKDSSDQDAVPSDDNQSSNASKQDADVQDGSDQQSGDAAVGDSRAETTDHDAESASHENRQKASSRVEQPSQVQSEAQPVKPVLNALNESSDQVRFTIQGIERTLTHAAEVDLATIASNTRLGRGADGRVDVQNTGSESPSSKQVQAQSNQQQPIHTTSSSPQKQEVAELQNQHGSTEQVRRDAQQVPVDAKADRNHTEVQVQRSRRAGSHITVGGQQAKKSSNLVQHSIQTRSVSHVPLAGSSLATSQRPIGDRAQQISPLQALNAITENTHTNSMQRTLTDPTQSQEPTSTERRQLLAQVQRGLASLLKTGQNQMTLKLTPGHLGELKIQVKTDGQQMAIRFEATTEQAASHIRSSLTELTTSFQIKGISIDQIEIEQAGEGSQSSSINNSSDSQKGSSRQQHSDSRSNHEHTAQQGDSSLDQEDTQDHQDNSIWTQLGLDAIA